MTLRIETGHVVTGNVKQVDATAVRIVTQDGRTLFAIELGDDGRSIELRAVDVTRVDGKMYESSLQLHPRSSNSVIVRTREY